MGNGPALKLNFPLLKVIVSPLQTDVPSLCPAAMSSIKAQRLTATEAHWSFRFIYPASAASSLRSQICPGAEKMPYGTISKDVTAMKSAWKRRKNPCNCHLQRNLLWFFRLYQQCRLLCLYGPRRKHLRQPEQQLVCRFRALHPFCRGRMVQRQWKLEKTEINGVLYTKMSPTLPAAGGRSKKNGITLTETATW